MSIEEFMITAAVIRRYMSEYTCEINQLSLGYMLEHPSLLLSYLSFISP